MSDDLSYGQRYYRRRRDACLCVKCGEPLKPQTQTTQCVVCKRSQMRYEHRCRLLRALREGRTMWRVVVDGRGCGKLLRPTGCYRKRGVERVEA